MAESQSMRMDPPLYNSSTLPYDPALPVQQRRPMMNTTAALPSASVPHRSPTSGQAFRAENKSADTSKQLDDVMFQYQQQQQQQQQAQAQQAQAQAKMHGQYAHPSQTMLQQTIPQQQNQGFNLANYGYAGTSGGKMAHVRDTQVGGKSSLSKLHLDPKSPMHPRPLRSSGSSSSRMYVFFELSLFFIFLLYQLM